MINIELTSAIQQSFISDTHCDLGKSLHAQILPLQSRDQKKEKKNIGIIITYPLHRAQIRTWCEGMNCSHSTVEVTCGLTLLIIIDKNTIKLLEENTGRTLT